MCREMNTVANLPLLILMLNMFILQLGVGLVIPILPQFMQELGAGGTMLGNLLSLMGVAQFLFSSTAGEWSDRYGRKYVISAGFGMFALGQLIFALAQQTWLLYMSRLIAGVGVALMHPALIAYVADVTTDEQRGKGLGWLHAAMSLGIVIGPCIGGLLTAYGIRAPFYISTAIAVLATLLSLWILPETRERRDQLAARSLPDSRIGIIQHLKASWKAPYFSLLLLVFILTFGLAKVETVFGLFVAVKYGLTPQDIAVLISSGALLGIFVQTLLIDYLLHRFREKTLISLCLLCSAISLLLMLLSGNFWYLMGVTLFYFTFLSVLRPAINTLLSKMAGDEQGFVAGINNAYSSLGIVIGPAIAGILFDIDIDLPYICGAVIILLSLVLSVFSKACKVSVPECS